ncbi:phospholipase D-like domain-containing protein [Ectobacillus ponti]|uniref:Phospholipase D-like domain-containing protein n=1 Tax=Ectobacillus ponti TaxID=2961894 RepID=A0AA41X721_9BACI|nr:phospholipase D-like domain-containing protein [Ectobacillus ponti]MCP8967804.1 phospholipase D-like domain-containing protein [Ectobacillus ponti]
MKKAAAVLLLLALGAVFFIACGGRHAREQLPMRYPMRHGDIDIYTSGRELYKQLFSDIAGARQSVHISFFSIGRDQVSRQFLQLLRQKSREGVPVYYAVDLMGGILLPPAEQRALRKAGVHFAFYNKPGFPYLLSSIEHRNHRRIALIDGKIGYTGGLNIGKKYLGEKKRIGRWRDYHVRVQGGIVQDFERQFTADWRENTGEELQQEDAAAGGAAQMQLTAYSGKRLADDYAALFRKARSSITLISPYLIPNNEGLWAALADACKRHVTVRIVWSPHSDALLVEQAAYPYIRKALRLGIEVYAYKGGVDHGKLLLIDRQLLAVGTVNLDSRSLHVNDELNLYIHDAASIQRVLPLVQEDIAQSRRLRLRDVTGLPLHERFLEQLARMAEYYL